MIDDIGWNMANTEQNKDVFWYESEIKNLTTNNGLLIENITELQEQIEHNLRRIKELRNIIKKEVKNEQTRTIKRNQQDKRTSSQYRKDIERVWASLWRWM